MPKRADGWQQSSGFTDDSTVYDGDITTGYIRTVNGADSDITLLLDMGASPPTASKVHFCYKYNDGGVPFLVEYAGSLSGPWTTATFSGPVVVPDDSDGTTYFVVNLTKNLSPAVAARYWRFNCRSGYNLSGSTNRVGGMEFELLDGSSVHISENPSGTVYTDQPISNAAGKSSESDELDTDDHPNAKGAGRASVTILESDETVTSKAGGRSSAAEVTVAFETLASKTGGKSGQSDELDMEETLTSASAGGQASIEVQYLPGGGILYQDVVTAKAAGGQSLGDPTTYVDTPVAKQGGHPSQNDTYSPLAGGNFMFDVVRAYAGGKASLILQQIATSSATAKAAGKTGSTQFQLIVADTVTAKAGGRFSTSDGKVVTETVTAKAGGKGTANSLAKIVESGSARAAGKTQTIADSQSFSDSPNSKVAGRSSTSLQQIVTDTVIAKGAGKAVQSGTLSPTETVTAKAGGRSSEVERVVSQDRAIAKSAGEGATSPSDHRVFLESVVVRGGSSSHTGTQMIATIVTAVLGAGASSGPIETLFRPNALIPALRYNARIALPECTQILESLNRLQFQQDVVPPFLVIVAQDPRPYQDGGVMDVGVWVPVDFVYVSGIVADGSTDTPQYLRQRLGVLEGQIQKDYHEFAGTIADIVRLAETVSTPMSRRNAYQEYFAEIGHQVDLMVLSMEFAVVDTMVPA